MKSIAIGIIALLLTGPLASADSIPDVGTTKAFPAVEQVGVPIQFALWQWSDNPAERKELMPLKSGARIAWQTLPKTGIHFKFRVPTRHDTVKCLMRSSDGVDQVAWGPEKVNAAGAAQHLYRAYPEQMFVPPQTGRYLLAVEAWNAGKSVARCNLVFDIVDNSKPPRNTRYLQNKKDRYGNPITTSQPIELGGLNETPVLKDNDYPFEPQRAFNIVNFERFPPFALPPRFLAVWESRRFVEEALFGGPLNRGFTSMATVISAQDNLPIRQRTWFHTPDQQVAFINPWYAQEPEKYADLKAYADYRSAFVSAANSYKLGWACYASWGAGGYGPYDAGLYGWDEEQMWPTIGIQMLRDHPELLPEDVRHLRDKDPKVEKPETQAKVSEAYSRAWADFIGNFYRGARACAASRGRAFRVWQYGSKAPGEYLFLNRDDSLINAGTGKYRAEEIDTLWPWFQKDGKVDFTASLYAQQVDYFNKDFYYHTLFPQTSSMYEKDANGKVVLDAAGRRKIRQDVFEENVYAAPTKIGYEDCEMGPVFLKAFVAKGENALYWLNGGKTYTHHGTLLAGKQLVPTLRPGNQETWGECAKFGSRPVNPYLAEAATIYTYMIGLEGLYLWDSRGFTGPVGYGEKGETKTTDTLGDIEFMMKGMHRVSQFNPLFIEQYDYIRPVRAYDTHDRDHPLIRGLVNGRYLLLAMTNPYLDPSETQQVEIWYDTPYQNRKKAIWSGVVTLRSRKNHIFQCKLPALSANRHYDPARLYFRYTCLDGAYRRAHTVTGNYDAPYSFSDTTQ